MSRRSETKTGGRDATTRHIFGQFALSVGMPSAAAPAGWQWVALADVARMESGHTPSRNRPEYWGGDVPWIGIRDAKAHHGQTIEETIQTTNELGIQNSSARILPEGTVCLSRTASVGYVVTMGRPMATSQDFANWICSDRIDRRFLVYLFLAEQDSLLRFASGAIHQTIYYPELKAFHICLPSLAEQQRIIAILDEAFAGLAIATANAEKNFNNARELFDSFLNCVLAEAKGKNVSLGSVSKKVTVGHVGITSPYYRSQGILFLRTQNVSKSGLLLDDVKYITKEFHESSLKSRIQPGDVLISRVITDRINCALIPSNFEEANCANVILVRPGEQLNSQFLLFYIRSMAAQNELLGHRKGSAQQVVNTQVLREWNIRLPSIPDQLKVVAQLEEAERKADQIAQTYERKVASLFELKQSILGDAFSGQLKPSPSQAIEEAAE